MILPSGFTLNGGGTNPSNFLFPDAGNGGNGSFIGNGTAGCTPPGCTDPHPGTDIMYQLSTDLTCTANPDGTFGGLEDSFAGFGARNTTGSSQTLDLRFTSSFTTTAMTNNPMDGAAEVSIFSVWAVPSGWCIELESCSSGLLIGGTASGCPAGFITGTTLEMANSQVNTDIGNASDSASPSNCDVNIIVPNNGITAYGDLSVTSSCDATVCGKLMLSDAMITGPLTEEGCKVNIGPNYTVEGPDGDLLVRAGQEITIGIDFSVEPGGQLTLEIDPALNP